MRPPALRVRAVPSARSRTFTALALLAMAGSCSSQRPGQPAESQPGPDAGAEPAAAVSRCGTVDPSPEMRARVAERLATFRDRAPLSAAEVGAPEDVQLAPIESNPIPVWFHVIRKGDGGLSDGNIPEDFLDLQINMMNHAFRGDRGGVATPFRFFKAGVKRVLNPAWFVMSDGSDAERQAKQSLRVGGATTLNIYIAEVPGTALGYATFPWEYDRLPYDDGVVIDWPALPAASNGSLGFTAVHEIGHWVGLYHTFQNGCTDPPGDEVADTLPHTQSSSPICTAEGFKCRAGVYPVRNYMNTHNDECMFEFTLDQLIRMRRTYTSWREVTRDDLITTGGSGWTTIPIATARQDDSGRFDASLPDAPTFANLAKGLFVSKLIGDFNNDGRHDVALLGGSGWTTIPMASFTRQGTVTFTDLPSGDFPALAREINATRLVGDFNRDGRSDLALLGAHGRTTIPLAFSNGDGTFTITNLPASSFPSWAAQGGVVKLVGDWNGDGRSDFALTGVTTNTLPVAQSNGSGTFDVHNRDVGDFAAMASASGVIRLVGDFDGDGRHDIALTGGSGWNTVPVAFGRGDGQWHITKTPIGNNFAHHATAPAASKIVGDFNGDGLSDIALTGNGGWSSVPIAFSLGTGEFDARINPNGVGDFAIWSAQANVARIPVDFNNDGRTDIALTGNSGWTTIPVAFSNGDGSWRVTNEDGGTFAISTGQSSTAIKTSGTFKD